VSRCGKPRISSQLHALVRAQRVPHVTELRPPAVVRDLRRAACGDVIADAAGTAAYSSDFGRIVSRQATVVVRPHSAEEVQRLVRFCAERSVPLVARAAGHSLAGISVARDAITVDLRNLVSSPKMERETSSVVVAAGTSWIDVLRGSCAAGFVPPVVTGYPHATVGGTLSTVGWGDASFRYGAQLDNCISLEVAIGSGEIVTCSEDERADLFAHCLGGLGQFGIITSVRHRLRQCRPTMNIYRLRYAAVASLLDHAFELAGSGCVDRLEGRITLSGPPDAHRRAAGTRSFSYVLRVGMERGDIEADAPVSASTLEISHAGTVSVEGYLTREPRSPEPVGRVHPWVHAFVPRSRASELLEFMLQELPIAALGVLGDGSSLLLSFGVRDRVRMPMLRLPDEKECVLIALSPVFREDARVAAVQLMSRVSSLMARFGGRAHLGTWFPIGTAQWKAHFGEAWDAILAAKQRYDPNGIFNPALLRGDDV
jgi:cytokinin dehydrogenase